MKLLSLFVTALANQSEDRKFTNDNEFMSQDTPAWWLNKPAVERLSTLVSLLAFEELQHFCHRNSIFRHF